ncbi:hypothetical protein GCM10028775_33380 [Catellatospora paridis]
MRKRLLICLMAAVVAAGTAAGCSGNQTPAETPGLAARGTVMTTVKPTRQELTNRVSLTGKVAINPVFGLVTPVSGQIRYLNVQPPTSTPKKATRVASVWKGGKAYHVTVPAGAAFAGRLVDDRSTVQAGMPVVSAKHVGYAIVAEIDGAQAYKLSAALTTVRAQITNGPGPFACKVLGTIAALPSGTLPEPPAPPAPDPSASPAPPVQKAPQQNVQPSEATGMRLVCLAPAGVTLINGASATLEVITAKAANALVLPVEAVAGGQGKGLVDVVRPDGTRETRDVVLGLTDGKVIEIKSGLTGEEKIAVPGPDLPQAQPENKGPEGVISK